MLSTSVLRVCFLIVACLADLNVLIYVVWLNLPVLRLDMLTVVDANGQHQHVWELDRKWFVMVSMFQIGFTLLKLCVANDWCWKFSLSKPLFYQCL